MEAVLIIIGYTLVTGSYVYTWKSIGRLWKAIEDVRTNDIKHVKQRLRDLEGK